MSMMVCKERIISHDGDNRNEALVQFKNSKLPLIMLSPSMERGVDLPGDDCRFVILIKVPFPYLGDAQIKARLYQGKSGRRWYNAITARRLVQATGRGMRSADDYCDTYVLDANFARFYAENKSMFPAYWKQAVILHSDIKEVMTLK
jgi:Rad3-related DNA helicase